METKMSNEMWEQIVATISEVFGFDAAEQERFTNAQIAHLIAAMPFVAGCKQPMRTALAHLGTYIIGTKIRAFDHSPEDSENPYSRFREIMNFHGGNSDIIASGMGRLALVSYGDHFRDAEADKLTGKYNPIVAGEWMKATMETFQQDARRVDVPEFDAILPVAASVDGIWEW